MKKMLAACIFALALFSLSACGKSTASETGGEAVNADTGSNYVTIKKDGAITNTIEEDFDPDYYDEEALKEFAMEEASEYNGEAGESRITIKKLEVKKNRAALTMEYQTAEDFGAFNGYPFFCGTVAEAYEEGYDLDAEYREAGYDGDDDDIPTIGRDELLEMGSRKIVIAQAPDGENLTVETSGKILYVSGDVQLVKKKVATIGSDAETDSTVYIIYK